MEDHGGGAQNLPAPPPRLFERLAQLSGYTWDQSTQPFHSVGSPLYMFSRRPYVPEDKQQDHHVLQWLGEKTAFHIPHIFGISC